MVTIKDIANKAGVSISTVSYAINGSEKISNETKNRILAIAEELNYTPNSSGRNLKRKETKVIGVFVEDYSGPFFGELFSGMREALNKKGYELIVCSGEKAYRFIPERVIDGAIILDETFPNDKVLNFAKRNHKLILLDREIEHTHIGHVLLDNHKGAKLAIEYLNEKGHKKLYVLKADNYDGRKRLQAVRRTISHYPNMDYIEIEGHFNKSSGEQAAKQIVDEYTQPAAVFCFNDEMAIGVYNYVSQTDLKIGEHIHIIGFDNIELSQYIQPRLATIDYSRYDWGYLASECLLSMINNQPVQTKIIDVSLVEGHSVQKI